MRKVIFFGLILIMSAMRGQDLFLADEYLKSGEPEKALVIYLEWFDKNKRYNPQVYDKVWKIYIQSGKYDKAAEWLAKNEAFQKRSRFEADRYHLYRLTGDTLKAEKLLNRMLAKTRERPSYALTVTNRLKTYHYLDEMLQLLEQAARSGAGAGVYLSLGNVYAEKGMVDPMMDAYLQALVANEGYYYYVTGVLSKFIGSDPGSKYNMALKRAATRRVAEAPDPVLLKLLQWLYVKENNYRKAFIQLRGLYKQGVAGADEFAGLAESAMENGRYDDALDILEYALEQTEPGSRLYDRLTMLYVLAENQSLPPEHKDIEAWKQKARTVQTPFYRAEIYAVVLDHIMYDRKDYSAAHRLIDSLLQADRYSKNRALWREKKADVWMLEKKFDPAAIEYTLLREDYPNEELNYRALYKIALASFFAGDFDWSHTVLKTLKKAAGKEIANDALYLDFLLIANKEQDSLRPGLRFFSDVYFDYYAKDYAAALEKINSRKDEFSGNPVYDDLLYLKALILWNQGRQAETEALWKEILAFKDDKIYREEALYRLGVIYEQFKNNPSEAKRYFQTILTEYPQGYWFEEAQKHFRGILENQSALP